MTSSLSRSERPLCRVKMTTSFDERLRRSTTFLCPEFGSTHILEVPEFRFNTHCMICGRKLSCKNYLDSFTRFNRTPTCDRHRDTDRKTEKQTNTLIVILCSPTTTITPTIAAAAATTTATSPVTNTYCSNNTRVSVFSYSCLPYCC